MATKILDQPVYSLREKKYARTKVALAQAFIERLESCRFDDIPIKEICAQVEVSEGTFFNYFPEKIDLIDYYIQLNDIWLIYKACIDNPGKKGLVLIESVFGNLAVRIKSLNLVSEFIAAMLRRAYMPELIDISSLEKQYAFSDCPGIEDVPVKRLGDFFRECLVQAVKDDEFIDTINIDDAVVSLRAILTGVLCAVKFNKTNKTIDYYYKYQLMLLWKGLRAKR